MAEWRYQLNALQSDPETFKVALSKWEREVEGIEAASRSASLKEVLALQLERGALQAVRGGANVQSVIRFFEVKAADRNALEKIAARTITLALQKGEVPEHGPEEMARLAGVTEPGLKQEVRQVYARAKAKRDLLQGKSNIQAEAGRLALSAQETAQFSREMDSLLKAQARQRIDDGADVMHSVEQLGARTGMSQEELSKFAISMHEKRVRARKDPEQAVQGVPVEILRDRGIRRHIEGLLEHRIVVQQVSIQDQARKLQGWLQLTEAEAEAFVDRMERVLVLQPGEEVPDAVRQRIRPERLPGLLEEQKVALKRRQAAYDPKTDIVTTQFWGGH